MLSSYLPFQSLVDVQKWQKFQDNFSVVTDVSLRLVDSDGNPITKPSREPRLCGDLLIGSPQRKNTCGSCLPTFLGGRGVLNKNFSYECQGVAGLHIFVAPLILNNKAAAYFLLGPLMLVMRRPKEEYAQSARELGLDLEDLWSALLEIKVSSFHSAKSTCELIRDLGEYTLRLSYQNVARQEEVLLTLGRTKLATFLEALLDVAFEISGADVGSVMFLDKDAGELTIKAAKGIPEDVVRNTRVKLGSQISGIAVKEGRSFLLDGQATENRLRPYLKRPQITSSMVIPLKIENEVVGVMNIGALDTSAVKFSPTNLKLMNRLLDLAALAIHT